MDKHGLTNQDWDKINESEQNGGFLLHDDELCNREEKYSLTCEQVVSMSGTSNTSINGLVDSGHIYYEEDELMLDGLEINISDIENIKVVY